MTKKTNKNLFGMTVTALNDKVVSCAHMEINDGYRDFKGLRNAAETGKLNHKLSLNIFQSAYF